MTAQTAIITIQNLKCHGCANTITTQLSKLEAISDVKVNKENAYNAVVARLSSLGYPVEGENNALHKKAKSFVSCAVGRMNA